MNKMSDSTLYVIRVIGYLLIYILAVRVIFIKDNFSTIVGLLLFIINTVTLVKEIRILLEVREALKDLTVDNRTEF